MPATTPMPSPAPQPPAGAFHEDANRVLTAYRSVMLEVVRSASGEPGRGLDLERSLGLDKTLAWKVASAASCSYPFDVARHIPGKSAMKIIVGAGKKHGIKEELLRRVERTYAEYERLIDTHAGDRASLEMMLCGYSEQERAKADREYRKAAFRANSYLFGIQSRTSFRTYIMHPSASDPTSFDFISLRGHAGLRRIRTNAPWVVHRPRVSDDSGENQPLGAVRPLDPEIRARNDRLAVPWMRAYCSDPIPDVRRVPHPDGRIQCEILEGPVGNAGRTNFVLGEMVAFGGPLVRRPGHDCLEFALKADLPIERLIFDQIMPVGVLGGMAPELSVYSEMTGPTPTHFNAEARQRLPVDESPQRLGQGLASMHCAEIPDYERILGDAFAQSGWDPAGFVLYRSVIEYPPIPSTVVHFMPLPEG